MRSSAYRTKTLMILIALTFVTSVIGDDSDDRSLFGYDSDKNFYLRRSLEDKAFNESGICVSQNRSYVETCRSPEPVANLNEFKHTQCYCDVNCNIYDDCCIDVVPKSRLQSLPWSCHEVKSGFLTIPIYVLQKCADDWYDTETQTLCEVEASDLENSGKSFSYLQDIPVKSRTNGFFYRNVYCAMCNYMTELEKWNVSIHCAGSAFQRFDEALERDFDFSRAAYNTRTKNFQKVFVNGKQTSCRIIVEDFHFKTFVQKHKARFCKPTINTCSSNADEEALEKCNSYTSYVYQNGYPLKKRKVYKNFHCALCNNVEIKKITCVDPFYLQSSSIPEGAKLSLLFDFNFEGDNNQIGIVRPCKLRDGLLWDPVMKKCKKFTCGALFEMKGSKCVPRNVENNFGGLNNSCFKRTLIKKDFSIYRNRSILLKQTGELLLPDEYEINEKDRYDILSINVCAGEGSYLLHLSSLQYWISEITLSLSIIFLMLHLFVYASLKELRNCPGKVLMSLSSCIVCGHLFLLIGQHTTSIYWMCYVFSVFTHFGYLSSFLWMNVMAYDIYQTFCKTNTRNSNSKKSFAFYSLYSLIIATFIVTFSVVFDNVLYEENEFRPNYADPICWFNRRKGLLVFFIIPVFILLVMNVIFFISAAFHLRKISKETKMVKNFSDNVRYLLYIKLTVVFGLTWLFGILAGILRVSFLWYPFILLNGLQGVFIFVSFTVKKKIIRHLLIKFRIHSDSYKIGKESAVKRAIYSSLSNLSTLHTTLTTQLPTFDDNQEILKAVRKINPDSYVGK